MRYLVDTHYLIWSLMDPDKMEPDKRYLLINARAVKHVSKISYWEIALKYSLGKLELKGISPEKLLQSSLEAGYQLLDISEQDLVTSYKLPSNRKHKDPFGRLLIWQCIRNDLVFLTADSRVQEYTRYGLKLA